ncbi:hypothetical protein EJB05_10845 [Eragrostis curvula]|uniref:BZIP domain-containing protein n=1 Tax=Eragrostis curvula TaxID=38414 RepID=A0A5J9VPL5_9POAL|nr:hypothetical protein EJB05_10845 [Eragrostis curvula]
MAEPSLLAPVAQDPFADLPFPDFQAPPVDDNFAFEDFDLDDLDLDVDFDLDLFAPDGQLSPPPPPLATSSSSAASPERGSSSSGAGADGGLRNEESSESSSRSATGKDSRSTEKGDGPEDEAKRRARLVRNRESAHLSRQRKKQYVEELEGKVKAMQATIADLSARISCVTAENAALKQQLGGAAGGAPPSMPMYPAVYPLPLPMPWVHPAYAMRGSQVPLVPIPRLKPQQPAPAAAEPPAKKARKTKKVASVSLLGLLCLFMVCGCLIPAVNRMSGAVDAGEGAAFGPSHHGRVLAVEGPHNIVGEGIDPKPPQNASETLPALLYLPRNGKHVKINGNLVIKSIAASEKASSRMSSYDGKSLGSQGKEETGLAIPGYVAPLKAGEVMESTMETKNKLMALAPGDGNIYRDDDGLLPQWFSEAMSGPMLSSGMCTEVFQFDVSPSSTHSNGIVPVYSNAMSNSSQNFTENLPAGRPQKVNRRILYNEAIPLQAATSNDTEHLKAHPKNESYAGSKPVSSVVVSVLADPREAGDGNSEGRISSKSLSRIFVVVLIDSVKGSRLPTVQAHQHWDAPRQTTDESNPSSPTDLRRRVFVSPASSAFRSSAPPPARPASVDFAERGDDAGITQTGFRQAYPLSRVASMYIRVKRNKTTYFIQCEPTETALNIKQKLHSLIDQPTSNQKLVLLATNDVLENSKTLADQKVENDAVVALALRKDDNGFEEVFIARPEDFMSSSYIPTASALLLEISSGRKFASSLTSQHPYQLKSSKGVPFVPRSIRVFVIALCGFYVCYLSFNQISLENKGEMNSGEQRSESICRQPYVPYEELSYVHFPKPTSYSRGECACTPVRFFVIVSMQRSGSGWFETLLNSHPNISSNGEIFNRIDRRENISSILQTLDKLYNLDWLTSAAKNECTAAFGLKWMLNQGILDNRADIVSYLNKKGVSVLFLFRRNTLRRLISVLANDYDRDAKQLNGTHKSHVHSKEEAEILAKFRPELDTSNLIINIRNMEKTIRDSLDYFNSTRHMILYYEDIIGNSNALSQVQEFLGVPVRKLISRQVKIHTRPLPNLVKNWEEVSSKLNGTEYARFLDDTDYAK